MSPRALESDAPRPVSRLQHVLVPSSDNRLNRDGTAAADAPPRKRSHDVYAMEDMLKASIVVKPHPSKLSIKPRSLQPLMLLPREHLPLACLDLATPSGDFEYARIYESTIKILDLESRLGARPVVLIARLETNRTVYALERQNPNLYSLCKLGQGVDLQKLSSHAIAAYSNLIKPHTTVGVTAQAEASTTPQLHKENKKRRLAIEAIQSLVRKPARSHSVSTPSQGTETPALVENDTALVWSKQAAPEEPAIASQPETGNAVVPAPAKMPGGMPSQPRANEIFENVRSQYLEALYHSMGSLAYFAKGPLSRARAAFYLDCDSELDMNELIDFLKGLILTTVQIDKKYRESVPDIIAKVKTHIEESADEYGPKAKKRKPKKMKVGKDSLYPSEDDHVRTWWNSHKPQPKDDESTMVDVRQESKLQISFLRSRETQLQMILILEILALEPLRNSANESQLPGLPTDEILPSQSKESTSRKRNKHNLPVLLDVHADRLSIWQSTSLDDMNMLEGSQGGQCIAAQKLDGSNSDPLKDFCVEIILPFFSSRLPEQCDSLNKKLGGPVIPSPPKLKLKKSEMAPKVKNKPGAITKRAAVPRLNRTLDKVLFKETERNRRSISRGPSSVIALMRSASTSLPLLKREPSDSVSLANIPNKDSAEADERKSRSSSHGPAKRQAQEDKAKRDAEIQAELSEAISGLRKPNRTVVGKAMAEADERRITTSLSQLRKSKKPTQHPGVPGIVKATPVVGSRFRNALARESHSQPNMATLHESIEADQIPSSASQRLIPSSAVRKRKSDSLFMVEESSPALPAARSRVDLIGATPAKPSTLKQDFFLSAPCPDEALVLASSPIAARKFLAVPLQARDSGIGMPSSPSGRLVDTPIKRPRLARNASLEGYVTVTPAKKRSVDHIGAVATTPVPSGSQMEGSQREGAPVRKLSIMQRLGWDDDFDDGLD